MATATKSRKIAKEACKRCGRKIATSQMSNHLKGCRGKNEETKPRANRKSRSRRDPEATEKMESALMSVFNENPDRQVTTADLVGALQGAGFSQYNVPTLRTMVNDLMKRIKGQIHVRRVKRGVYRRIAERGSASTQQQVDSPLHDAGVEETPEMIRLERDLLRTEVQKLKEMLMRAIM